MNPVRLSACNMLPPAALVAGGLFLAACGDKGTTTDDTAGGTDTTTKDTGAPDVTPVWEDVRLETSETIYGIYPSGAGMYAVTTNGQAWVRTGGVWSQLVVDVDGEDLNGLWGSGTDASMQMIAVGDAGMIATWDGTGFSTEDVGTIAFETIAGSSASDLIAAGGGGGVYSNLSGTWTYEAIDGYPKFNHLWYDGVSAAGVGPDGVVVMRTGETWTESEMEGRPNLYGISGTSGQDLWAVGEKGTVAHYDGATWTLQDVGVEDTFWAVYAASAKAVYIVGSNGIAMVYNGSTWSDLPTGVDHNLYTVTAGANGVIWASGNRGMTLKYTP